MLEIQRNERRFKGLITWWVSARAEISLCPLSWNIQCSNLPSHLLVDGIIYDSHIDSANLFNDHFVNIASSVVLNKNTSTTPNWDYLTIFVTSKLPVGASFTIPPITTDFVLDSLRHLPTGKAVGLDGLLGYFLKLSAPSIASFLTTVFNLSLSSGSFPDFWKKA